jgi:SAM-dependent methyltransferase
MRSALGSYFDRMASTYDAKSARGLWRWVRGLEARSILSAAGPLAGHEVLELGCGAGFYAERFREAGAETFGVDSSPSMIRELKRKGFAGICAEVGELDLQRSFDLVLAAGLVEFVTDPAIVFRAAHRHSRKESRLLLLAPRAGLRGIAYELWHAWRECPARAWPPRELLASAESEGWRVEKFFGAGPLARVFLFRRRLADG